MVSVLVTLLAHLTLNFSDARMAFLSEVTRNLLGNISALQPFFNLKAVSRQHLKPDGKR